MSILTLNKSWKYKESFPKVSAYTTSYNCVKSGYPLSQAIRSFSWADEIVVVDGGSTDGTIELLNSLREELGDKLQVHEIPLDESSPGKDGEQKSLSRAICSNEYLIQFDADEICFGSEEKWRRLLKDFPEQVDVYNLLVVEPVGSSYIKMNQEHTPWKWRVYRNKPEITHGIPMSDRTEIDGKTYSRGRSDGCFPINIVTGQIVPSYTPDYVRKVLQDKETASESDYADLMMEALSSFPCVLHVGHVNLFSKIKLYVNSWHNWWCMLYNKDPNLPENNLFFPGVHVKEVTDEMISKKVQDVLANTKKTVAIKRLNDIVDDLRLL